MTFCQQNNADVCHTFMYGYEKKTCLVNSEGSGMPNRQPRSCCDVLEAEVKVQMCWKDPELKPPPPARKRCSPPIWLYNNSISRTHRNFHRNFSFPGCKHTKLNSIFMLQNADNDNQTTSGGFSFWFFQTLSTEHKGNLKKLRCQKTQEP